MKKLFITLASVLLYPTTFAQHNNSLLYEISGNNLTTPSYLFGTFHIMCADDYVMPETVTNAFQKAEQVVLELDMDDPQLMLQMQQQMFMQDGQSLKTLLTPTDYQLVGSYFRDSLMMPFQMLEKVKPFALTSMLYPKILDCPLESFEMNFVKLSQEQEKEILGLENVTDQMNVFDKIPYKKQADDLVEAVQEMANVRTEFRNMVATYNAADVDAIAAMVAEEAYGYAEFTDILLTDRNKNWIPKIANFAQEKSTFFAVGAGHLGGQFGVIRLLHEAGYTVRPIN